MEKFDLMEQYAKEHDVPIMLEEGIKVLLQTIKKYKCKSILEVGTAIGYSAIQMAKLDPVIHIDTLEIDKSRYNQAIQNVEKHGLSRQISLYLEDALDFSPQNTYDFIFVDAAKGKYSKYLERFLPFLQEDGIIFFDNLCFHGMVDNPGLTKSRNTRQLVKKIKKFRDELLLDQRFEVNYLPDIGDGVAIVSVKKA